MITTADQYNQYLHIIYNNNPPTYIALPNADNIYNIDIHTREVDAPPLLAVEKDNISETIYFIIDRYVDYMDLALTSCIITYENAKGITRIYTVPFYDIYSYAHVSKMIIPWNLDHGVTEAAGTVKFSIQFFKVGEVYNKKTNSMQIATTYSFNTQIAQSQVLKGISTTNLKEEYVGAPAIYEQLFAKITDLEGYWREHYYPPFWSILDEEEEEE